MKFLETVVLKFLEKHWSVIYLYSYIIKHVIINVLSQIAELYDDNRGEVYEVKSPSPQKRRSFFKQLFLNGLDSLSDSSSQGDYSSKIILYRTVVILTINRNKFLTNVADLVQILSPKKLKGEKNRKLRSYIYSSDSNRLLGMFKEHKIHIQNR